jgi:diaminohydroxyphosphoribosylaminopyrimidine deaminase/5-amino-6-(5-phosphoribosylamino)uracil reductase
VLVIAAAEAPAERVSGLRDAGAEVVTAAGSPAERVGAALDELGRRGVTSLLLAGGATVAGVFIDAGEVDEARILVAPVLLGGAADRPLIAGEGVPRVADAPRALSLEAGRVGADVLLSARLREW